MLTKRANRNRMHNPIDRLFRNDFIDIWNGDNIMTVPSINVREEKNNYKVEMAAPGLKKEDFNINVEDNVLTISSEKESGAIEGESENFSRREYNYSSFSRSITLPDNSDSEKIAAKYTDGILNLTIPKKASSESNNVKKIKVE